MIRTSLAEQRMKTDDTVRSYKLLTQVERAFRSFKSMDLKVRPIRHRRKNRVRAHVFLCMWACHSPAPEIFSPVESTIRCIGPASTLLGEGTSTSLFRSDSVV